MAIRDTGPLNRMGRRMWGLLLLIASVGAFTLGVNSRVVTIATNAAEEKTAPLQAEIDVIKNQNELDRERLSAALRNIYRICLKDQIRECEQ